jgi:hypothetical protein
MWFGGIFGISVCAAMALFAGGGLVSATEANAAATPPASPEVTLVCTVSGRSKHHRELTAEAICARFLPRIREALTLPVKQAGQVPAGSRARWVKVDIRLLPRDRAEAALTTHLRGKATKHPLLAVQVMDKPLGLGEIDTLARLAGRRLAAP